MTIRIQVRRDTYQNWYDRNPLLAEGEITFDNTNNQFKIGIYDINGNPQNWRDLPYTTVSPAQLADILSTLTNNFETTYIPLTSIDVPNGIPSLNNEGYVPDTEISLNIARSSDLSEHVNAHSGVHGVVGNVVGTTDTQDLSNKRIIDTLYFTDGVTIANEGQIFVNSSNNNFEITANYGNLNLNSNNSDIVLSADGNIIANSPIYVDTIYSKNSGTDNLTIQANQIILQNQDGVVVGGSGSNGIFYVTDTTNTDIFVVDGDITLKGTGQYLGSISSENQIATVSDVSTAQSTAETYTDTAVANLVNSAPATLNTLKELADAINDDANFATTIANSLATKITASSTDVLTNKTISISSGIISAAGYDNIDGFKGQSNIPVLQDGIDKGGKISVDSNGVITVDVNGSTYSAGIAVIGGGTRIIIVTPNNTLTGKLEDFNAALIGNDFATQADVSSLNTSISNAINTSEQYTRDQIDFTVNDLNRDIQTAKSQAITTSETYTDAAITSEVLSRNNAISTAKSEAISTSEGYTDSAITAEVTNRNNFIATAKSEAETYTDNAVGTEVNSRNYAIGQALSTSEGYTDAAISNISPDGEHGIKIGSGGKLEIDLATYGGLYIEPNTHKLSIDGYYWLDKQGTLNAISQALSTAEVYTDSAILTEQTNRDNAIFSAKTESISISETYTDDKISTEVTNRNNAIATAKSQAIGTAEGYTDSAISTEVTNRNSAISTAKSEAISTSEDYTDTAVANLVNSAPAALNTLKELADAINDDASFATTVTNHIATAKTDAEGYTDSKIATEVTNRNNAISSAVIDVESYTDTSVSNAISTSETYTDDKISIEVTNRNSAISTAKSEAISTSEGYTDSAISTEVTNRNSAISTAKSEAISTSEGYTDSAISTEVTNRNSAISALGTTVSSTYATKNNPTFTYTNNGTTVTISASDLAILPGLPDELSTITSNFETSYIPLTSIDIPNGIPSLDNSGYVPDSEINPDIVRVDGSQVLTNKTISGVSNTFTNISNSSTTATSVNTSNTIVSRDSSGNFNANMINLSGTPSNPGDVVTKAYADSIASALNWHQAVHMATATVLPQSPVYADGSADASNGNGVGATLTATSNGTLVIDGVTSVVGYRVLVKDQTNQIYNGIYTVTDIGGDGSHRWVLTRATDADNHIAAQLSPGDAVFVQYGTVNAGQGFIEATDGTNTDLSIKIGTDNIHYYQFTGTATLTAGAGLASNGNVIDVVSAGTNRIVVNADSIDLANITRSDTTGANQSSRVIAVNTDSYGRVTGVVTAGQNLASTSTIGIASFNTASFTVTSGNVEIKPSGISNTQLQNSSININGSPISLGGSISGLATNASPTFTGNVTLPLTTAGYVTTTSGGVISSVATIPNAGLTNSSVTVGTTEISLGSSATTLAGLTSVTSTAFTGSLTGNASTATTLATPRNINGVAFDGSAGITVTAAAGTLTGSTLNSNIVTSSLTTVGTLNSLTTSGDVTVGGNLIVNGITTTLNSTTLTVTDKNIEISKVASPTDTTADGAGITVKGTTDKTFNYINATPAFTSSENLDLAIGKTYKINGDTVLSNNTLGSNITSSSLTSLGTLTNLTVTNTILGSVTGNAGTATKLLSSVNINGVAFDGSAGITVTAAAGTLTGSTLNSQITSSSLTSVGTITSGVWNGTTIDVSHGGTGLTTTTKGGIFVGTSTSALTNLPVGSNGYLLTADSSETSGVKWAAAPVSLPSQTGNNGYWLTTNGTTASWSALPTLVLAPYTISTNDANTVDTTSLSSFTTIEYILSIKQGSHVRSSKILVQTDGTNVDYTEYGIIETGGTILGVNISAIAVSTNMVLQVIIADASSTNGIIKLVKNLL